MVKSSLILFFCVVISACNSTSNNVALSELEQNAFAGYENVEITSKKEIFALSEEAKKFAKFYQKQANNEADQAKMILAGLFASNKLNLDYRAKANFTATQTFDSGVANCISLTILAHAMFEYVGISSVIQDVQIPEFWTIRDRDILINGHVNLLIKPQYNSLDSAIITRNIVVDFDPSAEATGFRAKKLSQKELISLFYNNIGAEYLIEENYVAAYAYFKAAIDAYSRNSSVWTNLGALYSRNGFLKDAEKAYRYAHQLDSKSLSSKENLAIILKKQGQLDEAEVLFDAIHKQRVKNPYYHLLLGDQALQKSEPELALTHFKTAIKIDDDSHMFHFAMARAYAKMGEYEASKQSLKDAKRLSDDSKIDAFYSRKLSLLAKI